MYSIVGSEVVKILLSKVIDHIHAMSFVPFYARPHYGHARSPNAPLSKEDRSCGMQIGRTRVHSNHLFALGAHLTRPICQGGQVLVRPVIFEKSE